MKTECYFKLNPQQKNSRSAAFLLSLLILILTCQLFWLEPSFARNLPTQIPEKQDRYQFRQQHDPDGIGKFYMGREIAQVMGHQGAGWLERSPRQQEERPDLAISALKLRPSDTVADIGAGTGYFSLAIAAQLSSGKVLAVDVQPEMQEIMAYLQKEKGIKNVVPILGTTQDPNLPDASVDLALIVDAYHEFDYPQEMLQAIAKSLKPNGRLALLEYKAENPFVAIKPLHKMSQNQVKKELGAIGFKWIETQNLPQQHLLIFAKPA
jgi:ubiquinone/menaquinone biosynthesis C-methylase UbiE